MLPVRADGRYFRRRLMAVLGSMALGFSRLSAQTASANVVAPVGSAAWYQVGRIAVDPATSKVVAFGYYTQIQGVNGPMFSGAPGEATAFFTFRTTIFSLIPVRPNGDVNLSLVTTDMFDVFYDANPRRSWSDPDSFATGTVVASFTRDPFLVVRIWESWGTE